MADISWGRGSIDAFVLADIEALGWHPAHDADPRTLMRRLSFDLTGLPPSPDQVSDFAAKPLDEAVAASVEELLASSHYAERMAMHWMDLVRYADTVGYHGDQDRPMSPYRDYVLQAFADNMPFDRFVREQLAGDLLPGATLQQKVASGYNRLNQITAEGGAQDKEYLAIYAADRVRTTATTFLGSTLACAQCHDHKFDPFSARDFYSFAAFFADIEERGVFNGAHDDGNWGSRVEVPTEDQVAAISAIEERLSSLDVELKTATPELQEAQRAWESQLDSLPIDPRDHAWAEDNYPEATIGGAWNFVDANVVQPLFGEKVRLQSAEALVQHFFHQASETVTLNEGDHFYTHVWLDPDNPPETIMLQFNRNGSWEHRPYWGADKIVFGGIGNDNDGHRPFGDLPPTGKWVRIEVDPERIGLNAGDAIEGMAFVQFGGLAYWDNSGLHAINPLASLQGIGLEVQQYLGSDPKDRPDEVSAQLQQHYLATAPLLESVRIKHAAAVKELDRLRASVPTSLVSQARGEPRTIRILPRGDWMDDSGEVVLPAVPAFLPQPASAEDSRLTRLDLADWITDPRNPLTARAFVNRLWALFFGRGLSYSLEDLGAQGEWPTHPRLLDWLADEFIVSGWDVKHMVRLIVSSRAYRQGSVDDPMWRKRDPDNRSLARQAHFRLPAEFVRDQALAASGLLDRSFGGVSVKPYQPEGYWRELNFPMRSWQHDASLAGLRRGLYTYWCRTFLHPSLLAFDATTREECTVDRARSNTPQQALVLLNDPSFVEAARGLAIRAWGEGRNSDEVRIDIMLQYVLQRDARPEEQRVLLDFLASRRAQFAADPESAKSFLAIGDHASPVGFDPIELAAAASTARAVLNLHESITRY
ncbi:MAG: DUF1549 and DUF1553 domain-containing protein [Planctomycetes bacterium]|nr:DUF1549 and DUF1553 domain-containing protein [Planctomycetota bacterium]